MKKNRFIKVLVFFFAVALFNSAMVVQANATTSRKQITTKNVAAQDAREDEAKAAVDALFTDDTHMVVRPDLTQVDIDEAEALVNTLPEGTVKEDLSWLIARAQYMFNQQEARNIVNALYRDREHTTIRDDLTKAEISYARAVVEELGPGAVRVELRVLIILADLQLDSREAVYALFTDDTRTAVKADLTQTDIDKAKELVDSLLDQWPIKEDLSILIFRAQFLFNQQDAQRVVYALYADSEHTVIRDDLTQAEINHAKAVVEALPAGPIKVQLRVLIILAQVQFDEKNPELILQPAI